MTGPMPILASDTQPQAASRYPGFGPIGSVYQPSSFLPTDQNSNVVAQGGVPPSSNFKGLRFPTTFWDNKWDPGNPLAAYSNGSRNP